MQRHRKWVDCLIKMDKQIHRSENGRASKWGLGLLVEGSRLEGIWAFAGSNEDRLFPGSGASGEC